MGFTKPTRPAMLILQDPQEKKFQKNRGDDSGFQAQAKLMNFGLELMKFLSPSEVSWYGWDLELGDRRKGSQGVFENNAAWWSPNEMYILDKDEAARGGVRIDDDTAALQDGHGSSRTDPRGFYARTHRSAAVFAQSRGGAGPFAGSMHGVLKNVNLHAGLGGGLGRAGYKSAYAVNNTWNHFEVTEANRHRWDYGVSSGYQSASAYTENDWGTMNRYLNDISAQVIKMKDAHVGYDHPDFHMNFDRQGWTRGNGDPWNAVTYSTTGQKDDDGNPISREVPSKIQAAYRKVFGRDPASKTGWTAVSGKKNISYEQDVLKHTQNQTVKSVAQNPYDNGHQTQAPNYYEIIMSGAWSKWVKGATENPFDMSKNIAFHNNDVDGAKFYYFVKGMLESRRRLTEFYRVTTGAWAKDTKFADNSYRIARDDKNKVRSLSEDKWKALLDDGAVKDGTAGLGDGRTVGLRTRAKRIKWVFDNIANKTHPFNSFYNMLMFKVTHSSFNILDSIAGRNTSYTDVQEFRLFRRAAAYGMSKYMINDGALERRLRDAGFKAPTGKDGDNPEFIRHGTGLEVKIDGRGYFLGNADKSRSSYDSVENYTKLYNAAMSKWKATSDLKYLKVVNFIAPMAEFFYNNADNKSVPVADFSDTGAAHTTGRQLNDDQMTHSMWTSNNGFKYDGWSQIRGHGSSWVGAPGRRDGVMSIFQLNPKDNEQNIRTRIDSRDRDRDHVTFGADGKVRATPNSDKFSSVWLQAGLDLRRGRSTYVHQDGLARWGRANWGGRGGMSEIDENPVYAYAAYGWQTSVARQDDITTTMISNMLDTNRSRRERAQYREKLALYEEQKRDEKRTDAKIRARAIARRKVLREQLEKRRRELRRRQQRQS